jgi:hypothetical protein
MLNTFAFTREQLIPMLGLVPLQHTVNPRTTFEKLMFLIEYSESHAHILTTTISFSALAVLLILRRLKKTFVNYWWIYRLPEVLIVVIVSTSKLS